MEKGLLPFNKQASEVNDFYLQSWFEDLDGTPLSKLSLSHPFPGVVA